MVRNLMKMIDIVEHVRRLDQIEQRTPEWYAARENMLTASDVAASINKNPYQSRKQLLQKKVKPAGEFSGNFATIHGNKYEDEARFLFAKLYGLETWEVGLFRHLEFKWLGGSPDGIASDGGLLEIKCPIKRKIEHNIPEYYYPQVQICMEILDIEHCWFIQYQPETIYKDPLIDIKKIPRSRAWFAENFDLLKGFWDDVIYHRNNPDIEIIKKRVIKPKPINELPVEKPPVECLITSDPEDCSEVDEQDEECIP